MFAYVLALLLPLGQFGQSTTGELRLTVVDASGAPLRSDVELVSQSNQFRAHLETDSRGMLTAKRLPFGTYRVAVTRDGFAMSANLVEVRSALPTDYHVTLSLAPVQAQVTVAPEAPLLDPHQVTAVSRLGGDMLQQRLTALPGRSLPDLVQTQPGWLLEANGIVHPRGSEYQTQYVVDGLPLTDNRSPAFAPEIGAGDVQAMSILTGGYPAEYGRKLGGVIEVVTAVQARRGFHGSAAAAAGSFATGSGNAMVTNAWERTTVGISAGLAATDRYLDPPVEENFTNHGTTSHVVVRVEHDVTDVDRFGLSVRRGDARFLVPNEYLQQTAGQRQDRTSRETAGLFSYQRIFSAHLLADVRGMARDISSTLRSNAESTPILAQQDRGFGEFYVKGAVTGHVGRHEWKAGADVEVASIRERFGYQITDGSQFDPGTPAVFSFDDTRPDHEQSLFVQDQLRIGAVTVSAGIRWDHYRLVVDDHAFSPRVGVAWSWPAAGAVLRASYDRAFQTPSVENLLLASSAAVDTLNEDVLRLPVRPSRGNFYEAGFSKSLFSKMRLDASHFRRTMNQFADDDLLLNTGVSFPIAFQSAEITGTELKLDIPRWGTFSGSVGYSHMHGVGELPITGGLFLGDEAATLATSTDRFTLSQEQRHTVRARVSDHVTSSVWIALAASYGSGLPVEFTGDPAQAVEQYGQRIVDHVDFDAGRVRPSFSLDASAGLVLARARSRNLRLQIDVRNLTNRFNLINFAGLFSGTALAAPGSIAVRLQVEF